MSGTDRDRTFDHHRLNAASGPDPDLFAVAERWLVRPVPDLPDLERVIDPAVAALA